MRTVLNNTLAYYRKQRFFDSLNAAFGTLKNDSKAWSQEQEDRQIWERTLSDSAEPDEIWTEDGNVVGHK